MTGTESSVHAWIINWWLGTVRRCVLEPDQYVRNDCSETLYEIIRFTVRQKVYNIKNDLVHFFQKQKSTWYNEVYL